ncbi:glycosyltransferase family 4 protein [Olivibacter sp. CPCC 100613]|uniref:glycosyltransferase family 4 protein n=1 Tax=Olivibacter sp. CPCC 100613 TaxID=3079931 RepID=UPI002FFB09A1
MKILYINALYSPFIQGGAEISLKAIAEGMQATGHEVVVLSLKPNGVLSMDQVDGVKVYRAALKNVYWPFEKTRAGKMDRMLWHVRDRYNTAMKQAVKVVLEREKPDIVSCHNLVGWSVAIWDEIKSAHIPIVQVLHDLYLLCPNSDMFKGNASCDKQCFSCALLRQKHKKLSTQVDAVVGISKFILGRFEQYQYFNKAKRYVIYNTREIPQTPLPPPRIDGSTFTVGYIGTLAEKKGIEWLIDQFQRLSIKAQLLIAGGGKKDYELFLQAKARGTNISFIGYTNPEAFYKTIDVLVVPSLWQEPLGMVAIEALAYHVPVIANAVGGLQETVKDGFNGLLCTHEKNSSLGDAIQRLYDNPLLYNTLVKNARLSVQVILSKQRMINEYSNVLNETIHGNKG